jgi:hypothetical protein
MLEAPIRDDSGAEAYTLAKSLPGAIVALLSGVLRKMSGHFRCRIDSGRLVPEREFL